MPSWRGGQRHAVAQHRARAMEAAVLEPGGQVEPDLAVEQVAHRTQRAVARSSAMARMASSAWATTPSNGPAAASPPADDGATRRGRNDGKDCDTIYPLVDDGSADTVAPRAGCGIGIPSTTVVGRWDGSAGPAATLRSSTSSSGSSPTCGSSSTGRRARRNRSCTVRVERDRCPPPSRHPSRRTTSPPSPRRRRAAHPRRRVDEEPERPQRAAERHSTGACQVGVDGAGQPARRAERRHREARRLDRRRRRSRLAIDGLVAGQHRLANEQARYQIAFREDLARLAEDLAVAAAGTARLSVSSSGGLAAAARAPAPAGRAPRRPSPGRRRGRRLAKVGLGLGEQLDRPR